jgi:predicted nucleic acid-binding protein
MIAYLDTSVILRFLLSQGKAMDWRKWNSAYSSELCGLEARRVIDRLRLQLALDDPSVAKAHHELSRIEQHLGVIPLNRSLLRRAALPMPTIVKTLDAIHLTSALMLRENKGVDIVFATHDIQQATGAQALGFEVSGIK